MNDDANRNLLTLLEPPEHGWERLRARRAADETSGPAGWMALVGGAAVAAIALIVIDQLRFTPLTLPPGGARLLDRPVPMQPLRLLDAGHVRALSATDGVRVYWAEPAGDPAP